MNIQLQHAQPLVARYALLVYSDESGQNGVVMQHVLTVQDGIPHLAEGRPVTNSVVKKLSEMNQRSSLEYIPTDVVAQGIGCIAWIHERQDHRLLFQGAPDPAVAQLDGKVLPQPRLLFIVRNARLSVYALRGHERPGPTTPLYRAPYFNIFQNNEMCIGSTRTPGNKVEYEHLPQWVEAFFMSNFVKPADSNKRWDFPGTYRELWDAAAQAGEFKDEWLYPTGTTLGDVIGGR